MHAKNRKASVVKTQWTRRSAEQGKSRRGSQSWFTKGSEKRSRELGFSLKGSGQPADSQQSGTDLSAFWNDH